MGGLGWPGNVGTSLQCVCDKTQPLVTTEPNHFHDDWQGHDMTDSHSTEKKKKKPLDVITR